METKLSPELSNALNATDDHRLVVVDPATNRHYVIVEAEAFARLETLDAIRTGIAEMESGRGQPLAEAFSDIREKLKRPV